MVPMRMEAPMGFLRRGFDRLHTALLPWRCLLCGAPGEEGMDLCAPCAKDMPRNHSCCTRCALAKRNE